MATATKTRYVVGSLLMGTLAVMAFMETYKFKIFYNLADTDQSYMVFPWATVKHLSKSTPEWLTLHLATAMIHVFMTVVWILKDPIQRGLMWNRHLWGQLYVFLTEPLLWLSRHANTVHLLTHTVFSMVIVPNLSHFGDKDQLTAVLVNSTPLVLCNLLYLIQRPVRYWKVGYFLQLTSPIWFETGLYVASFFGFNL